TPLHLVAARGDREMCKVLIQFGADVRASDGNGTTPLHLAAREGHADVCRLLVSSAFSPT
ncbi:MAG: ankyrin repeat domain-containing protein, partial [Elioraea sp.]|nr:ankyrin repeat domain-containing protein [Elioraea sp.]